MRPEGCRPWDPSGGGYRLAATPTGARQDYAGGGGSATGKGGASSTGLMERTAGKDGGARR